MNSVFVFYIHFSILKMFISEAFQALFFFFFWLASVKQQPALRCILIFPAYIQNKEAPFVVCMLEYNMGILYIP